MKTFKNIYVVVLSCAFIACNDEVPMYGNDKSELNSSELFVRSSYEDIPGVVLAHSPKSSRVFLVSPSICILDDGSYLASFDLKPQAENNIFSTWIMKSTDKGKTWNKIATLRGQFYSQLFTLDGVLYTMGTTKYAGPVVIRKSIDGGLTWTNPTNATNGVILSENYYATAPTPVVVHAGRVWRAMEDNKGGGDGTWGHSFRAFMISAPINSDLLDSSSWTVSWKKSRVGTWLGGNFNGWLEGNAVVGPNGQVINMLRVNYDANGEEMAALIKVNNNGKDANFNPATDFIQFPGGCKKFVVRYDESTNKYWALSNYSPDSQKGHGDVTIERTRNTLALSSSTDLRNWKVEGIVLHHPDRQYHAFQYPDFQFEGNDIVLLSRTAYDDGVGGADSQHNANHITFHRIKNYKNYQTPSKWIDLLP